MASAFNYSISNNTAAAASCNATGSFGATNKGIILHITAVVCFFVVLAAVGLINVAVINIVLFGIIIVRKFKMPKKWVPCVVF